MEETDAIAIFAALAHATRLSLFRILVREGAVGISAGSLAERLGVAPSTLSHHLSILEHSGLIGQTRRQRNLIYAISPQTVRSLTAFLLDECCNGRPDLCGFSRTGMASLIAT